MTRRSTLKTIRKISPLVFLVFLTSCGLIERFKTPSEPTSSQSTASTEAESTTPPDEDAFFSEAFNDAKPEEANELQDEINKDSPSQINTAANNVQDDLDQFEKELTETKAPVVAEEKLNKDQKIEIKEEAPVVAKSTLTEAGNLTSETATYTVKSGETLMQISFKLYGELSKWKTLRDLNSSALSGGALRKGMKIKYYVPETPFAWNPEGTPYLIKNGDTLGTIANSVYQTPKKWKKIWENNKPLIKNPNKIYAGFTLYYLTEGLAENTIQENTSRENYVETTQVDKIAAKEMDTFKAEISQPEISNSEIEAKIEKAVTISDAQTLGSTEEELLTVTPISNDNLLEEVEQINASEVTKSPKTDEQTMTEIEELASLRDEEISNTQSSVQK